MHVVVGHRHRQEPVGVVGLYARRSGRGRPCSCLARARRPWACSQARRPVHRGRPRLPRTRVVEHLHGGRQDTGRTETTRAGSPRARRDVPGVEGAPVPLGRAPPSSGSTRARRLRRSRDPRPWHPERCGSPSCSLDSALSVAGTRPAGGHHHARLASVLRVPQSPRPTRSCSCSHQAATWLTRIEPRDARRPPSAARARPRGTGRTGCETAWTPCSSQPGGVLPGEPLPCPRSRGCVVRVLGRSGVAPRAAV